jgi:hypothetical protein
MLGRPGPAGGVPFVAGTLLHLIEANLCKSHNHGIYIVLPRWHCLALSSGSCHPDETLKRKRNQLAAVFAFELHSFAKFITIE